MLQWLESMPDVLPSLPFMPKPNNMNAPKKNQDSTAVMEWLRQNVFSKFISGEEDEEEGKLTEDDLERMEEYIFTEVFNVMCAKVGQDDELALAMLDGEFKVPAETLDNLRNLINDLQLDDTIKIVKRFKKKASKEAVQIESVADIMQREIELFLEEQNVSEDDSVDDLKMNELHLA